MCPSERTRTSEAWIDAHHAEQARIEQHPKFNQLIRKVAIAECCLPPRNLRWLQRNSRTYGAWMTRRADGSGGGVNSDIRRRRGRLLCTEMARELFPDRWEIAPREPEAQVWVAARQYAEARVLYHPARSAPAVADHSPRSYS